MPKTLRAARRRAYAEARATLDSAQWRSLMLDLAEWLFIGPWLTQPGDPRLRDELIPHRAVRVLDRSLRCLDRRGRHLTHLDDHARHRVRIEAKKLRYAAEFFETLFPSEAAKQQRKEFGRAIEALLDKLGVLNDLTVVPAILEDLGIRQLKFELHKRKRLLKEAKRYYIALGEITRFWQHDTGGVHQ